MSTRVLGIQSCVIFSVAHGTPYPVIKQSGANSLEQRVLKVNHNMLSVHLLAEATASTANIVNYR